MRQLPSHIANKAMVLAAFSLPALALTAPSGYSFAALLLCGLGAVAWVRAPRLLTRQPALVWLGLAMGALAIVWTWDAAQTVPFKVNALDRPIKFALIWLALPAVLWVPPPPTALRWGVWVGAIGAAATACWQIQVTGMDRAWGHTNAIQFGNLALLMGVWSALWAPHATGQLRWLAWAAAAAGLYATVASESRGGWWVALVLCPLAVWLVRRTHAQLQTHPPGILAKGAPENATTSRAQHIGKWAGALAFAVMLGTVGTQAPRLVDRTGQAWHEAQLHLSTGESTSSVGQRLAHWKLAWGMGLHRPLTGWGEQGYQKEKARLVEAGQAPSVLLSFHHVHNEWLDMWAKHGLLGLLVLCGVYAVPGFVYTRALRQGMRQTRAATNAISAADPRLTCAVCGLLLVVGYVGFGMTQVMFAHNSSSIMYVFMNLLWMGAMLAPDAMPTRAISAAPPQ